MIQERKVAPGGDIKHFFLSVHVAVASVSHGAAIAKTGTSDCIS